MLNNIDYQKLECIHVALQDLQNKYSIPEDDSDLDDAFKFVEDIRDALNQADNPPLKYEQIESIFYILNEFKETEDE